MRNEDVVGILQDKSTVLTVTSVKAENICPHVHGLPASTHHGPVFGGREAGLFHAGARQPPDLE